MFEEIAIYCPWIEVLNVFIQDCRPVCCWDRFRLKELRLRLNAPSCNWYGLLNSPLVLLYLECDCIVDLIQEYPLIFTRRALKLCLSSFTMIGPRNIDEAWYQTHEMRSCIASSLYIQPRPRMWVSPDQQLALMARF